MPKKKPHKKPPRLKKVPMRRPMALQFDPKAELAAVLAEYNVPRRALNRWLPWFGCCSYTDLCAFARVLGDPDAYDPTKSWSEQQGWLNTFYSAVSYSLARIEMILHDSGQDSGYGPPVFYDPGPGEGVGPPPPPRFPPS
jgi:hypothetical protein